MTLRQLMTRARIWLAVKLHVFGWWCWQFSSGDEMEECGRLFLVPIKMDGLVVGWVRQEAANIYGTTILRHSYSRFPLERFQSFLFDKITETTLSACLRLDRFVDGPKEKGSAVLQVVVDVTHYHPRYEGLETFQDLAIRVEKGETRVTCLELLNH